MKPASDASGKGRGSFYYRSDQAPRMVLSTDTTCVKQYMHHQLVRAMYLGESAGFDSIVDRKISLQSR